MPENAHIVITGLGLVSPLGHSAWQTFSALLAGRTLADRAGRLSDDIGAVDLVQALGHVSVCRRAMTDPAVELAERAAREALFEADVDANGLHSFVGTSKGAVHALHRAVSGVQGLRSKVQGPRSKVQGPKSGEAALACADVAWVGDDEMAVALGPHGYLSHHLQKRLHLGTLSHVVAACASSLHALNNARLALLHTPGMERALVVTAEAALLPLFVHSYMRLGVLAPARRDDYVARPLDQKRCGFMLAELGAAVVLERVQDVQTGQIELIDTAVASESYDLIRTSPDMAALQHVAKRLLSARPIDMLHPHAPGTTDHDDVELHAYHKALGNSPHPDIYAAKGALGHGLGAAGLVSLVIACLCAKTSRRPPMPWLSDPIDGPLLIAPEASTLKAASTHAVFAAGFGGHVAGALIQRRD